MASSIDVSDLPQGIAYLSEVIGVKAALILVDLRGGTRLTLPKKPKETHWLVPHIGYEAFVKLCKHYGSDYIDLDRCDSTLKSMGMAAIFAEMDNGATVKEMALKYNYTERWLWICRAKRRELAKTADLFEEFA